MYRTKKRAVLTLSTVRSLVVVVFVRLTRNFYYLMYKLPFTIITVVQRLCVNHYYYKRMH